MGKVAPPRVVVDPVGKRHDSTPPVGFDVSAKGGDLVRHAARQDCHGSMVDPCRHRLKTRRFRQAHDPVGPRVGAQIDVLDRCAQKRIPHAAAHRKDLMPGIRQQSEDRARRR